MSSLSSNSSLPDGFRWIVGRKFKDDSNPAYPMPTDEEELSRMDLQRYMIRNYVAPVQESLTRGIKVLDAGFVMVFVPIAHLTCGTGTWSLEMAKEFPKSQFTAIDIIECYDTALNMAPPNLTFSVADIRTLPFPNNTFDYVFQGLAMGSFRIHEWPGVISELVRVTKPGGWVELFETEKAPKNTGPVTLAEMMEMRDININYLFEKEDALQVAGLKDVQRIIRSMPIGWGPEKSTEGTVKGVIGFIQAVKPQMVLALGLGEDEYDEMVYACEAESKVYKQFWDHISCFGRKPSANQI
ncbi:S-adenosyl-L-methionine-dependent methyltransferase [Endogone sp. FLAS-F59071]|nr:S-adenosyl-L-methionine-dependent methyltransferase [Endogone sp. FLAS-F59071]|eukprot:RUS17226.1 S-adenosyl-L-methionine-dependent methyltransferase [Endogone sp. FLAS-F59071]